MIPSREVRSTNPVLDVSRGLGYKGPTLAREDSNSIAGWSRVSLSLLMIMDDRDLFYHFSDEEDGEDALLARAYDRWAQLGGGPASRWHLHDGQASCHVG